MQSNSNYERNQRKERNARPPRGNEYAPTPEANRGKKWERENNKREQSDFFNSFT